MLSSVDQSTSTPARFKKHCHDELLEQMDDEVANFKMWVCIITQISAISTIMMVGGQLESMEDASSHDVRKKGARHLCHPLGGEGGEG
mmetsp:Transcript_14830/g.24149  ORF Transcript_14830/g.24149 Transcript_14830/m.24149 type:complete len:88 (-) Transcript_14830:121-384(-)